MNFGLLFTLALVLGADALDPSEVRRLSLAEEHPAALETAQALLASPAFAAADEPARGVALYTIGVAQHRADAPDAALGAFLEARDLAGPGTARLAAMYNLGTILLEQAEVVRATIPELAGPGAPGAAAPLATQPAPAPGSPAAPDEPPPDPLQVARAGYLGAREALLDRLRTDAADGDTRANLELIVRRLRELDELEQQREEQEQEQQEQEQDSEDQEPSEDSEDESSGEDSEDQQSEESEEQESDPQDQEQEEPSEEEQPPEDGSEDEESEGESEEQPSPEEAEEELMSSEEIQRLMDRLREIEEQARAVQAMLRRREQVPVEKDW